MQISKDVNFIRDMQQVSKIALFKKNILVKISRHKFKGEVPIMHTLNIFLQNYQIYVEAHALDFMNFDIMSLRCNFYKSRFP